MRRRKRDDDFDQDDDRDEQPRRKRRLAPVRRFGFRRVVCLGLIALVVCVGLLPRIASLALFRPIVVSYVSNKIDGKIEVGELSLGWFAPIQIGNFRIHDAQGNLVASIKQLRTSKSLSSLAFGSSELGQIELEQPTAHLVMRSGASNLEDVLAKLLEGGSSEPAQLPRATIKFVDGSVQILGPNNLPPAQLMSLTGQVQIGSPDAQLVVTASAAVQGKGGTSGPIQLEGRVGIPGATTDLSSGQLTIHAQNAPIDLAGLALIRFGQGVECQGQLMGDTSVTWSEWGQTIVLDMSDVRLAEFELAAPHWLASDRLLVQEARASGQLKISGSELTANQFKGQSEFATLEATGAIDVQSISQLFLGGGLPETDFLVGGNVDLARLTQMLPDTLRLRSGVQIQKADLVFQSFSRIEGGRRRFLVDAEARDFAGVHDGQTIRWTKPIRLSAALAQNGPRTMLESLQVDTNSISIHGQSDIQTGQVSAQGDLGQLQAELEQFFSLGATDLAGSFDGNLKWNMERAAVATAQYPISLEGACTFESLVIALPGFDRFAEPLAAIQFTASGEASRAGSLRIDAGKFDFIAGDDRIEARLLHPMENPSLNATVDADVKLSGQLASWLQRLSPILPLQDVRAGGTVACSGTATLNLSSARLQSAQYEIGEFTFDGFGLTIREPQVAGQGDLSLDWQMMRMHCADVTVASSSFAGRGANVDFVFDANGYQFTGDCAYRADVNKVAKWFGTGQAADGVHWFGSAEGTVQLTPVPGAIAGSIQSKVVDLTAAKWISGSTGNANPWEILWQEPAVTLQAQMTIDPNWDAIEFQNANVQSKGVQFDGQGTIRDLGRTCTLDLTGQWMPNWEAISAVAQGYAGRQIALRGRPHPETFRIQGPLFNGEANAAALVSPRLVAETSASWEEGNVLGMSVGPASIKANLNESVIQFDKAVIQVGPGRVHFNPLLDMRNDPQLVWTRGPVLESVDLTAEISQGWLKFIAPLLADATRVQGRFSLALDGAQIPLNDPMSGRASGQLVIDHASIEPGPLGKQLVLLVNTVKQLADGKALDALFQAAGGGAAAPTSSEAWVKMPPQQVGFKMEQQQIIHEGLTLDVLGIPVKTRGAIRVDGSLNLIAEIPILETWSQKNPALAGLRGKSIQVPIGGTLTQPRLDQRSLAQLSTQLFQGAAGAQIESRLNGMFNGTLQKSFPQLAEGTPGTAAQPVSSSTPLQPIGDALQKSAEDNLRRGLDRLLGPKK